VKVIKGLLLPVGLVMLAEASARIWGIRSDALAAPSEILRAGASALLDGGLMRATIETLWAAMGGLLIGAGLGLVMSLALGLLPPLARLLQVSIEIFRPIPSIALIPITLLVFGFGYGMEISVIAFACFWPMLIMWQAAIARTEPRLRDVGRALQLGPVAHALKITVPAALPRLFVGLRLAAGISLVVAVTVEITGNTIGLGYGLMAAQQGLRPELMLAYLLWVGLLGWGVNFVLMLAQRLLFGRLGAIA
jgi:ABC-type nitrate/sulfonate/bicarbonate transport system permease component